MLTAVMAKGDRCIWSRSKRRLRRRDTGATDRGVCPVRCFAGTGERGAVRAGFTQMALQA